MTRIPFPRTLKQLILECHKKYGVLSVKPYFVRDTIDAVGIFTLADSGNLEEHVFKYNGVCWRTYEDWLAYMGVEHEG